MLCCIAIHAGAQGMPFDLAERFIKAAEEKLGAPLPHSYRQAMMASNGGDVAAYNDIWNASHFGHLRSQAIIAVL